MCLYFPWGKNFILKTRQHNGMGRKLLCTLTPPALRRNAMTQPIPNGYHTLTPSFTFKDSQKAIEFYKKAFGAEVLDLMRKQNGQGVMHATLKIGDSIIMLGDEMDAENCS